MRSAGPVAGARATAVAFCSLWVTGKPGNIAAEVPVHACTRNQFDRTLDVQQRPIVIFVGPKLSDGSQCVRDPCIKSPKLYEWRHLSVTISRYERRPSTENDSEKAVVKLSRLTGPFFRTA